MLDSIFQTTSTEVMHINTKEAIISILVALALGMVISLIYIFSDRTKRVSANFALTLVILPAIVAVVMMLIGSNVARAISLGGVFTLVRFRSVPGDSKDIVSIFYAMTVGLATGLGYPVFAAVVTLIIGVVYFVLVISGYGRSRELRKVLKIIVPENLNFNGAFDDLFAEFTKYNYLVKVRTTNLGSLYELTYNIAFKNGVDQKKFLDELRCRNGNLNITISDMEMQEAVL